MRFTRLLAFATWVVTALLAMAAFAAFSPGDELGRLAESGDSGADVTAESSTALPAGVGAAAGRQAAFGFSQDMLSLAVPTSTTTTVAPPSTTTTVAPTTTTTTSTTSTTTTTTTAPAPAPTRTRAPLPPESIYALVSAHFAAEDIERAALVAWCESRYDANATHPTSRAAGLFQHLPRYWESRSGSAGLAGADIYDPAANTAVAAWLVYSDGGWKHWNASISCWGNGTVVAPSTTTTTTTSTTVPPTSSTTVPPTVPPTLPPSTTTTTVDSTTTTTTTTTPPPSTTSTTSP